MPSRHEAAIRVVIAGASSLRGKELKQWLEEESFPASAIKLLDEEPVAGTLTEARGEPAVIETVGEDSFEQARFVFFTGSRAFSVRHAAAAQRAGATVIDLSGGLLDDPGSRAWIPALDAVLPPLTPKTRPGAAQSLFLAPSAPADVAISLSAAVSSLDLTRLAVTFFQPVSELGFAGVEELESQVAKLLTFAPIGKSVFDAQVGFNMLREYGEQSAEKLSDARTSIRTEVKNYLAGRAPVSAIALVQAPVFYSHAFSAYLEFERPPATEELVARLERAGLKCAAAGDAPPNNVNVVGESRPVMGFPERDAAVENGVWIWGAVDNLRVPVVTAVSIAERLLAS